MYKRQIIHRSFGCYKAADISQYKDVAKSKWYYKDVAMAVQMGTYNGRSASSMAPDAPISRQEAMTVVARALELDYDSFSKTDPVSYTHLDVYKRQKELITTDRRELQELLKRNGKIERV